MLEYNSNVWNPTHKYLDKIDKIENVQRQFTKRITSISNLSYLERLSILELEPLELRRLRFDLIQYYKIMNNLTSINQADYFTHHHSQYSSRKPLSYLIKPVNSPNYLLISFFFRSVDCWNSLPPELKQVHALTIFKRELLTVDLSDSLIGSARQIVN